MSQNDQRILSMPTLGLTFMLLTFMSQPPLSVPTLVTQLSPEINRLHTLFRVVCIANEDPSL